MTEEIKTITEFDGGVGSVDKDAFLNQTSDEVTNEMFDLVDNERGTFMAKLAGEAVDYAPEYFKENPDGNISIVDVHLGGNTTMDINMESDLQLVTQVTTGQNELMAEVFAKVDEMQKDK